MDEVAGHAGPAVQSTSSSASNFNGEISSDGFLYSRTLKFQRTKDKWWEGSDSKHPNWRSVRFQLTDAREKELQGTPYLNPDWGSDDGGGVVSWLLDILKHVRHLKLVGSYWEENLYNRVRGGRLLEKDENPVPALESFVVNGFVLNHEDAEDICKAMKSGKLTTLTSLEFSDVQFGEEGLGTLLKSIGEGVLPCLSKLSLWSIGSVGNELRYLSSCPSLQSLDLGSTSISGSGHQALAQAMESGGLRALEILHLNNTRMGGVDCNAYATGLSSGNLPALTRLSLESNEIGDLGAEALGRAFRSGKVKTLVDLDLGRNLIGNEGMIELAKSFEVGPNLRFLNLVHNVFTKDGLIVLSRVLQSGHLNSLEVLELGDSDRIRNQTCAKALVAALASNNALTCSIKFGWYQFPDLDRFKEHLQNRNRTRAQISLDFLEEVRIVVPATFGKVYLCGSPEVGKTTLRESLERPYLKSLFMRETEPRNNRTRGIEISQLTSSKGKRGDDSESITLTVWDMAGQQEYHMVHNVFFPDLAFAGGKATSFVLVCNSQKPEGFKAKIDELIYWLRFIASSCGTIEGPRHVFVVLNRMNGRSDVGGSQWEQWLEQQRKRFKGYLEIRKQLFIVDARKRQSVNHLRQCLIHHSRAMLESEKVPQICLFIQSNLRDWARGSANFPVLRWENFVKKVQENEESLWNEKTLEAAAQYLNEAGVLLYIRGAFPIERAEPTTKFVVLDPNWLCGTVVGNIFVKGNVGDTLLNVNKYDGSVRITDLKNFFRLLHSEWDETKVEDLVAILLCLGLCYTGRDEKVFIPALIEESDYDEPEQSNPPENREDREGQWVMGFTVEHKISERTLAPIALWHRFQVELANSSEFNGEVDNDFVLRKDSVAFQVEYMTVRIKVDASNDHHPTFHSISIYVTPLWSVDKDKLDSNSRKECQVEMASSLVETLLSLWQKVCPGVDYVHRVVWPWPASEGWPPPITPEGRNMEVTYVRNKLEEIGLGKDLQWTVGPHDKITREQLLSTNESKYVLESAKQSLHKVEEGIKEAVEMGIVSFDNLAQSSGMTTTGSGIIRMPSQNGITEALKDLTAVVKEMRSELRRVHKDMDHKLLELEKFSLENSDRSCPRFIYIGKKNSSKGVTLKDALSLMVRVHLHFLCEAQYDQYGNYGKHPVEEQEGIYVRNLEEWARKILPWLKGSLAILLILAKVSAHAVAPGLGLIIPEFSQWQQTSSIAEGIALATGYSSTELDRFANQSMRPGGNSTVRNPQELQRDIKRAMTELLGKLTATEYKEKLGLQKVHIKSFGVAWICDECYDKFRSKRMVTDL